MHSPAFENESPEIRRELSQRRSPRNAILHLDPPFVELGYIRRGKVRYQCLEVTEGGSAALAAGAASIMARTKIKGQGVTLCLSDALFDSRQVLLANLSEPETHAVLARKAANGIGVSLQESLFWARRCEAPLAGGDLSEATWLVHARRRSEHMNLLLRLRKAGIRVKRTVAGRDLLTHMAGDVEGEEGSILVSSTGRAVYAHLFRGSELVQESRLVLPDFSRRADVYGGVVQDVRQLAAFWAKGSRGAPLRVVRLFGFSTQEIREMRTPLEIAAQGAELRTIGRLETATFSRVRCKLLGAFMQHTKRCPSLSLPLPLRPVRVAAATLAAGLLAGVAAWKSSEHWAARIQQRTAEIQSELATTEGVEANEGARERYVAARASLSQSLGSLEELPGRGVPLQEALGYLHTTLGRVVDIHHLSLRHDGGGSRFVLEASLPHDVATAARQLEDLRRGLEADPALTELHVEPASNVPKSSRGEALRFTVSGYFRGASA